MDHIVNGRCLLCDIAEVTIRVPAQLEHVPVIRDGVHQLICFCCLGDYRVIEARRADLDISLLGRAMRAVSRDNVEKGHYSRDEIIDDWSEALRHEPDFVPDDDEELLLEWEIARTFAFYDSAMAQREEQTAWRRRTRFRVIDGGDGGDGGNGTSS